MRKKENFKITQILYFLYFIHLYCRGTNYYSLFLAITVVHLINTIVHSTVEMSNYCYEI